MCQRYNRLVNSFSSSKIKIQGWNWLNEFREINKICRD